MLLYLHVVLCERIFDIFLIYKYLYIYMQHCRSWVDLLNHVIVTTSELSGVIVTECWIQTFICLTCPPGRNGEGIDHVCRHAGAFYGSQCPGRIFVICQYYDTGWCSFISQENTMTMPLWPLYSQSNTLCLFNNPLVYVPILKDQILIRSYKIYIMGSIKQFPLHRFYYRLLDTESTYFLF